MPWIEPDVLDLNRFETFVVAYSGGKDSTATLLWALENLPHERIRAVFCDTGAEWPETRSYLAYADRHIFPVERIANSLDLFDLIRQKGKWPGARFRWCTLELKNRPLRRYCEGLPAPLVLFGQRREESRARYGLPYFSFDDREPPAFPVYRPILDWSENDVWAYLNEHDVKVNPVYRWVSRANCWCCIMSRFSELIRFCRIHPDVAAPVARLEGELGHYWQSPQLSVRNALSIAQNQLEMDLGLVLSMAKGPALRGEPHGARPLGPWPSGEPLSTSKGPALRGDAASPEPHGARPPSGRALWAKPRAVAPGAGLRGTPVGGCVRRARCWVSWRFWWWRVW